LDGSEPNSGSTLYSSPIEISKSCVLKIRAFYKDLMPSISISIEFKKAILNEPAERLKVQQGLAYDYFERFFVTTDDLDISKPVGSGTIETFNIKKAPKETYFGYRYHGYIQVPKPGIYTFYLK